MNKHLVNKKFLAFILAAGLLLNENYGSIALAAELNNNSVSSDSLVQTFEINSKDDFQDFAENCRKNSWSKNKNVILNCDINLGGSGFTGISSFSGSFNGNGHTISGLYIEAGDEAVGLFRYLEANGEISDLTVSGTINSSDSRDYIGGIVGVNSGSIINCNFEGNITGFNVAGGIAGLNGGNGQIIECINKGKITSQTNVGGIAGINRGTITDSSNNGNVNSDSSWVDNTDENENSDYSVIDQIRESGKNIGGIAGWSNGIIANSTNNGIVGYLKSGENVGGIAGLQKGSIFYCVNKGKVYGKTDVGGIVGQFEPTIVIKGIEEIMDEVDILHDILDSSTDDIDKATDQLTNDMDTVNSKADNIADYANKITDEGLDIIEDDTDVANDLSSRTDYVSQHLKPINDEISSVLDELDKVDNIIDKIVDEIPLSDDEKEDIDKARKGLENSSKSLKSASEEASGYAKDANEIMKPALEAGNNKRDEELANGASESAAARAAAKATSDYLKNTGDDAKLLECITNMLEPLTDALNALADITGYTSDIMNVIDPYLDETTDSVNADYDDLSACLDKMNDQLQAANSNAGGIIDYLNSKDKLELITFTDNFDNNVTKLQDEVDDTLDALDRVSKNTSLHTDTLEDDMRAINDQMQVISDLVLDRIDNFEDLAGGENIIVDVSDEDSTGSACASITTCTNSGNVDGSNNVGGITGSIALDNSDSNEKKIGSKYEVAAVVLSCTNTAFVTAKNKNAGGIVGSAEVGYVSGCNVTGGVFSEEGNYIGGIAGNSKGTINNCLSLAVLEGNEYIGGIAGAADAVMNCTSIASIMNNNGRIGAIMGAYQADDDDITVYHSGMIEHIYNNYFVSDTLFGIDGVSYLDVAEPTDYEDILEKGMLFKHLRVYYVDEDYNLIDSKEYPYGYKLSELSYPDTDTESGTYTAWDKPDSELLTSNLVIKSEVTANVTVLSSMLKAEGKPVAMASGVFTKDVILNVTESDITGIGDSKVFSKVYDVELQDTKLTDESLTKIRFLKESEGTMDIYQLSDGNWIKLDVTMYGSYGEVTLAGTNNTVCVVITPKNNALIYYIAGIAAALIVIISAIVTIKGRKKKASKKADKKK